MVESVHHNSISSAPAHRRRHGWWLTGLLVTCLLPIAVSTAMMQQRWELMTQELARIAFQVPDTIRAVSRRRCVRLRRRVQPLSRYRVKQRFILPASPRRLMTAGVDVVSRRGPPPGYSRLIQG